MRVPTSGSKREYVFSWPLSSDYTDKVRFTFVRPDRTQRIAMETALFEDVTDERTGKRRRHYNPEKMDEIVAASWTAVDNLLDEGGSPIGIDFSNRSQLVSKVRWLFEGNLGLDEEEHGVFEQELNDWFGKTVLRYRDEDRKKNSKTAATDGGAGTG